MGIVGDYMDKTTVVTLFPEGKYTWVSGFLRKNGFSEVACDSPDCFMRAVGSPDANGSLAVVSGELLVEISDRVYKAVTEDLRAFRQNGGHGVIVLEDSLCSWSESSRAREVADSRILAVSVTSEGNSSELMQKLEGVRERKG
jgi:hypothetical protein